MAYRPPWRKMLIAGIIGGLLGVATIIFVTEPIRCYMGKTCLWVDGWK